MSLATQTSHFLTAIPLSFTCRCDGFLLLWFDANCIINSGTRIQQRIEYSVKLFRFPATKRNKDLYKTIDVYNWVSSKNFQTSSCDCYLVSRLSLSVLAFGSAMVQEIKTFVS